MLKKINTQKEFEGTISSGTWLVDFSATWCGPCRMLEPVLKKVSEKFNVIQIDVDQASELAMKFGVMSIPTLIVFKDGVLVTKCVGYLSEDEVLELISK